MAKTLFTLEGAKTVWVGDEPFTVPGTDLTIWKVKIENSDGDRELYSTMSKQIATEGFTGDIEVYENDKGKVYIRKVKKEDGQTSYTPSAKKEWQPRDDSHIRAQWAIGQVIGVKGSTILDDPVQLEARAKELFALVDRVKGSSESTDPKVSTTNLATTTKPSTQRETSSSEASGYEKFKASRPKKTDDAEDAEAQSLYASVASAEMPEDFLQ